MGTNRRSAKMAFKMAEVMKMMESKIKTAGKKLVEEVGGTYLFVVKKGDDKKCYLVDLKNGSGSLTEGEKSADCTITASDDDFFGMFTGKLNAQELFFGGNLKIDGDMGLAMGLCSYRRGRQNVT